MAKSKKSPKNALKAETETNALPTPLIQDNFYSRLAVPPAKKGALTPKLFWDGALQYFKHCEQNPIQETVIHQRTGQLIQIPRPRPYNLYTLCAFIGTSLKNLHLIRTNSEKTIKELTDPKNKKEEEKRARALVFLEVITHVTNICNAQKLDHALTNQYNANLVSRLAGIDRNDAEDNAPKRLQLEIIQGNNNNSEHARNKALDNAVEHNSSALNNDNPVDG